MQFKIIHLPWDRASTSPSNMNIHMNQRKKWLSDIRVHHELLIRNKQSCIIYSATKYMASSGLIFFNVSIDFQLVSGSEKRISYRCFLPCKEWLYHVMDTKEETDWLSHGVNLGARKQRGSHTERVGQLYDQTRIGVVEESKVKR